MKKNWGIFIHQEKFVSKFLNKYSMDTCAFDKVPMGLGQKVFFDPSSEPVDQKIYRDMIGSLIYLATSRPDIMF